MNLEVVCFILIVAFCKAASINVPKSELNSRIVGGVSVDIEEAPYQVSVLKSDGSLCGGAVLSRIYTLTSAYCVYRYLPNQIQVRAGTIYHDRLGQVAGVVTVQSHPAYNDDISQHDYDVAILRVSPSILIGLADHIIPVSLPPSGILWGDDLIVNVTGWGAPAYGGYLSTYLQGIGFEIIPSYECVQAYGGEYTERMLCAGAQGTVRLSTCKGDDGDPVVLRGSDQIVALVSYQQSNCMGPVVLTNIADPEVRSFIEFYTGL